jgi:protein TonB
MTTSWVQDDERSRSGYWLAAAIILSLAVHAAVFQGLAVIANRPAPPKPVEFDLVKPPPPPPPKPAEKEKPKFVRPKLVPPPPPPASNQTKPVAAPQEPPKPVFGVTPDSVVPGGEGPSIPVGNTLMKEPDKDFTPPDQVKPYYQPQKAPFVPAKLVDVTSFPSERDRVVPEYPPELRAQGLEGTVLLEVDIDETGSVVAVRIKRGTGLAFDQAAVKAIQASTYNPAMRGGTPVAVRVTIPVKFRLR